MQYYVYTYIYIHIYIYIYIYIMDSLLRWPPMEMETQSLRMLNESLAPSRRRHGAAVTALCCRCRASPHTMCVRRRCWWGWSCWSEYKTYEI
jgi:hypothetical protein